MIQSAIPENERKEVRLRTQTSTNCKINQIYKRLGTYFLKATFKLIHTFDIKMFYLER